MAVTKTAAFYSRTTNLPTVALWTLMGWVWFDSLASNTSAWFFGESAGQRYALEMNSAGPRFESANSDSSAIGSTILTTGRWYHIATVCVGTGIGQLLHYLDGKLEIVHNGNVLISPPDVLRLGGVSGNTFSGRMAFWKIWDAALTLAEIRLEMRRADANRAAGLHAQYPFNSTADDEVDFGPNGYDLTVNGTFSDAGSPQLPGFPTERSKFPEYVTRSRRGRGLKSWLTPQSWW